jgi:hypothetical protein
MTISELKISFIQFECLSDLLRTTKPPKIPCAFLLDGPSFQQQFLTPAAQVEPPWNHGYGKNFWWFYIRSRSEKVKDFWKALVPLEYRLTSKVTAPWLNGNARLRSLLYPWGFAVIADICVQSAADFNTTISDVIKIRRGRRFTVELNGHTRDANLEGMLALARDQIRSAVYGLPDAGSVRDPFSITTAIDGAGFDSKTAPVTGDVVHQALAGLCEWSSLWTQLQLGPFGDSSLRIHNALAGHVLYAVRRGRALLFPASFSSVSDYPPRLLCYHQNLTVASTQVESLGALALDAARQIEVAWNPASYSVTYAECARLAAGLLGRLYGPEELDVYRSYSCRAQIEQSYKDPTNTTRKNFNMPSLN